jgi:D-alanine-D-alanine ligase
VNKGFSVGLVYDLRSDYLAEGYAAEQVAEFDSDETIAAIDAAIRSLGHRTDRVGNARALARRLVAGDRWNVVFNIAEGLAGRSRESQVPCLLELYGIGYTFSDPLVSAVTLDKAVAKRLVREAGLATPRFHVVREAADLAQVALEYPLFAKPVAEGTGKGIHGRSRVESPEELAGVCRDLLARFAQPVLVEEFLSGREFTVGVLGMGRGARVLGTMEIAICEHVGSAIYSYETKEKCERMVRYSAPPRDALRGRVEALALESYRVLECRDAGRVDVRCDRQGRPAFLEVNPLPGLHPAHSDLPMIAAQEGMSYRDLIGEIVRGAARRLGIGDEP